MYEVHIIKILCEGALFPQENDISIGSLLGTYDKNIDSMFRLCM